MSYELTKAAEPRSVTLARQRRIQQAELRKKEAWAGYPASPKMHKLMMPDTLKKRASDTALDKLVMHTELQKLVNDAFDKRGLREQIEDLGKQLEKLEDRDLIARHGERGERVLQKRAAAHKGNAENMAGDEIIIDERGERHEVAELVKMLHQQGGNDLFKDE